MDTPPASDAEDHGGGSLADEDVLSPGFAVMEISPQRSPEIDADADKANVVHYLDGQGQQKSVNWPRMSPADLHAKLNSAFYKWQQTFEAVLVHVNKRQQSNSLVAMRCTSSVVPVCALRCKSCRKFYSPSNPNESAKSHVCTAPSSTASAGAPAGASAGASSSQASTAVQKRARLDGGVRTFFLSEDAQKQFISQFCMWM